MAGPPLVDAARARLQHGQSRKAFVARVIASITRAIFSRWKLYAVLTAENIHPGKGTPVTQLEMRRISDGVKISERYKTTNRSSAPMSRIAISTSSIATAMSSIS